MAITAKQAKKLKNAFFQEELDKVYEKIEMAARNGKSCCSTGVLSKKTADILTDNGFEVVYCGKPTFYCYVKW